MKHTNKELIEIYSTHKGDNIHAEYFIKIYEISYDEFEKDQDWEDENESVASHTLNFCLVHYLTAFLKYLKIGHNPIWADKIANSIEDDVIIDAYKEIKKENPELARKEIETYCKSLSSDENFKSHYLYLIEEGNFEDAEERAFEYTNLHNEQISLGKSEIYAREYARLRISLSRFPEIYYESYAFAYELSINEEKTENNSRDFADQFASYAYQGVLGLMMLKNDYNLELEEYDLELFDNMLLDMKKTII